MTIGLETRSYCTAITTKTRKIASRMTVVSWRLVSRMASSSPP
jgi:hypothetical protein